MSSIDAIRLAKRVQGTGMGAVPPVFGVEQTPRSAGRPLKVQIASKGSYYADSFVGRSSSKGQTFSAKTLSKNALNAQGTQHLTTGIAPRSAFSSVGNHGTRLMAAGITPRGMVQLKPGLGIKASVKGISPEGALDMQEGVEDQSEGFALASNLSAAKSHEDMAILDNWK